MGFLEVIVVIQMKKIALIILIVIFLFSASLSRADPYRNQFPETVLNNAFEKGCSLVITEILKQEDHYSFYYYKAKLIQPVILGDLSEEDFREPIELFAGASYGNTLVIGSTYALFVTKDAPFFFCWGYRDNVQKIDLNDKQEVSTFISEAEQVYEKTSISKFRNIPIKVPSVIPDIPEALRKMCDEFRKKENNRVELARNIYQSDLGSHLDESKPWSSIAIYLPPKILLSRSQVLYLLGNPTLKIGRTYHWFCGRDETDSSEDVGVLIGVFDHDENLITLIYNTNKMLKWKK